MSKETKPVESPEDGFPYKEHRIRFSAAGECFISKGGQCLGIAAGIVKDAEAAKKLIDEKVKGE